MQSGGQFFGGGGGGDSKVTIGTTNITVGAIPSGTDIKNYSNNELWKKLLIQDLAPTTSIVGSPDSAIREIGNEINIDFTCSANKRVGGGNDIYNVKLTSTPTASGFDLIDTMPDIITNTYTRNGILISNTTTFEILATDVKGKTGKTTKTYTFVRPTYYGLLDESYNESNTTASEITNLTKTLQIKESISALLSTPTGINKKFIFAYDSVWGDAKSILDVANSIELISNCTKFTISINCLDGLMVTYNCYIANIGGQYTNKPFMLNLK